MRSDREDEWAAFDRKYEKYETNERRPFPSYDEIFERETIRLALQKRARIEDDLLPTFYPLRDMGESGVCGMFGAKMEYMHRYH